MRMECEYTKHFESVRRIRNACAHNVCMLSSFKAVPNFKLDLETNFELLSGNIGIANDTISSRMVSRRQYFENNIDIKNAYQFARKVLDYYSGK